MTPDQIALVRQSFDMIRPMAGQAAGIFYARLFEIAPETRAMFDGTDMKRQGHKLMGTLNLISHSMDAPGIFASIADELGARHAGYGVRPEHYAPVGAALIFTFRQALSDWFDLETEAAWAAAYDALAARMIAASRTADTEAAE